MQPATFESGNSVAIDHLHCRYFVPREHPSPERISSDLDRIVRTSLADSCARALEHVLDPRDPAVWVIRSLEFTLSLDPAHAQEDRVGSAWGAHLAKAIVRMILQGPDGETVLRFPDRASYLAVFLHDLARGRAFDLWQYRSFASLRSLPQGMAAREALVREPRLIQAVLAALDAQRRLDDLLAILSDGDILRVVEAAVDSAAAPDQAERECAQLLVAVWQTTGLRSAGNTFVTPQNLLRLLVRATAGDIPWTGRLAGVAGHLLAFHHFVRRIDPERLVLALARGDVRSAAAEAVSGGDERYLESLPFLKDLAGGDAAWLSAVLETIGSRAAPAADDAPPVQYHTPFGGLLLLLPFIAAPESLEILARSGVDIGLAVLALLMKCAGGSLAVAVFNDSLLCRLAGVSPRLSARDLAAALPALSFESEPEDTEYFSFGGTPFTLDPQVDRSWSAAASSLLRRFAARLSGFERSSYRYLHRSFLDCAASVSIQGRAVEARLARPPLAILLQMSGYDEVTVRLPWLESTEVLVVLEPA